MMRLEPVGETRSREVSTISFPYFDLDEAIKVARTMHEFAGGVPLERDQVSAALNSAGGTLANKLSAAKQFGLIDNQQGKWSLTPLGYEILDAGRERAAKAEAFLKVELYRRAYDEFRGKTMPGRGGLEFAFVQFGVAQKQKEKARQTFERSAKSAGFFPSGAPDRLVQPITGTPPTRITGELNATEADDTMSASGTVSAPAPSPSFAGGVPAGLNPFIVGLLGELPPKGDAWPVERQADWLKGAAQIFRILYGGDGEIVVTVHKDAQ